MPVDRREVMGAHTARTGLHGLHVHRGGHRNDDHVVSHQMIDAVPHDRDNPTCQQPCVPFPCHVSKR